MWVNQFSVGIGAYYKFGGYVQLKMEECWTWDVADSEVESPMQPHLSYCGREKEPLFIEGGSLQIAITRYPSQIVRITILLNTLVMQSSVQKV